MGKEGGREARQGKAQHDRNAVECFDDKMGVLCTVRIEVIISNKALRVIVLITVPRGHTRRYTRAWNLEGIGQMVAERTEQIEDQRLVDWFRRWHDNGMTRESSAESCALSHNVSSSWDT